MDTRLPFGKYNKHTDIHFPIVGAFWLAKVPPSNLFSPSAPTIPQPATAQKAQQRPDSTQLQVRIPLQTPVTSYCVADHPSRIGFYLLFLAMLTFIFLICSLRTNVVLFSGLLFLVIAFSTLCGTYFHLALGNVALAGRLQIVSTIFDVFSLLHRLTNTFMCLRLAADSRLLCVCVSGICYSCKCWKRSISPSLCLLAI